MANDSDKPKPTETFAEAIDGSELGRQISVWLSHQTQLTDVQRQVLECKNPPGSQQSMMESLARIGPLALSVGTALFVLAIVLLACIAIWVAASERAVIVESLSVPQSLASRGVTGQVAASELLDRLVYMEHNGIAVVPGKLEVVPPGAPIKVEISATTITLDEAYVYLRNWLGHDMFVSGEIIDLSPQGEAKGEVNSQSNRKYQLVARVQDSACSAIGGDLDYIYAEVAGCVLRTVDPFRYAMFLAHQPGGPFAPCKALPQYADVETQTNICHALTILEKLIEDNPTDNAANALAEVGHLIARSGTFVCGSTKCARRSLEDAFTYESRALARSPSNILALGDKLEFESRLGRSREALADNIRLVELYQSDSALFLDPIVRRRFQLSYEAGLDDLRFDYAAAALKRGRLVVDSSPAELPERQREYDVDRRDAHLNVDEAMDDGSLSPRSGKSNPTPSCLSSNGGSYPTPMDVANEAKCFADAGDYPKAMSAIGRTPLDCYGCVVDRGIILFMQAQAEENEPNSDIAALIQRAEWWSEQARNLAPDLPGAWFDLGKEKMEVENWNGAAADLAAAHIRAPHNADILEYWGVALLEGGGVDARRAIQKFSEASIYAPQWGQLYQKWGDALAATCALDDASSKYRIAQQLTLTTEERLDLVASIAELPRLRTKGCP